MERIDRIRLDRTLPRVFSAEERHNQPTVSSIWLADVNFERGKAYCIEAGSGTGKTSLCSYLMGVRHDYEGSIFFNSRDISAFKIKDWVDVRRRNIAYLSQELDIFDELTAFENVMLKNRLTDTYTEKDINIMFDRLGIANRLHTKAARLSVGQRQRVALIRALCQPFDFILLDEPVSHLDADNNSLCGELVYESASASGAGVIFTSVGNPLNYPGSVVNLTL